MSKYKVIAICGKSASGKDTLLRKIIALNPEVHEIIGCTTRPPREHEVDGIDYFFLSLEEFAAKDLNNEMLETSQFREWLYGTSIDGLDSNLINVGVFNPTGIYKLMSADNIELYVVQVQAPDKVRLLRSLYRETNPDIDEIIRRYSADKTDFEYFSQIYEPDYIFDSSNSSWIDLELAAETIPLHARCHWAKEAN